MKEQTRCSTIDIAGRIEVLHARYFEYAFAPHLHDEFAIGLIDAGVEQFEYGGAVHRATQGEVVLLNAGEVHTGQGFDERGFGFRMLYVPESTFREIAPSSRNSGSGSLHFRTAVLNNVHARTCLLAAHKSFDSGAPALEVESRFVRAFAYLLTVAGSWSVPKTSTAAPAALVGVRDYLHEHLVRNVSLAELAQIAGLSKFHVLRLFRQRFGLTPHAYQLQQRILRAKQLLRTLPIADVAAQCGFADQSHLHRVFRSFLGTTPGRYSQQFRSRPA
ncbi:MAG TPA: AraC family transcriptional regulator [Edaphobacter sp.]|nr:AraC family transcriptional regulator [Edaphobacter sp.]